MLGDLLNFVTSDSGKIVNRDNEPLELNPEQLQDKMFKTINKDSGHAGRVNSLRPAFINGPSDLVDLDKLYEARCLLNFHVH